VAFDPTQGEGTHTRTQTHTLLVRLRARLPVRAHRVRAYRHAPTVEYHRNSLDAVIAHLRIQVKAWVEASYEEWKQHMWFTDVVQSAVRVSVDESFPRNACFCCL
jgi:hypothetical protein